MGLDKSKVAWMIPGVMVLSSVLIGFGGDFAREALRYDRVWLGQGELWRMVSGHFAHLSWSHLLLNSAGLALVWFLVGGTYSASSWLLIVVCSLVTIDLAFWFLNPELYWYVGMSGLLHGLLMAAIVGRWRWRPLDPETLVLLLLVVAKISWEQLAGPVPGSEATAGGPVVVNAHLYGAVGGILGALLIKIRVRTPAAI
jgi:rhomboid family GlyGly-CTERM serine protease